MSSAAWVVLACVVLVVLSAWLPVVGARRWVPRRWRAVTASLGAALGLVLTGWLAVSALTALASG